MSRRESPVISVFWGLVVFATVCAPARCRHRETLHIMIEHPKGCGEKHIHMTEEQIERNEFLRTAKYSAIDYFAYFAFLIYLHAAGCRLRMEKASFQCMVFDRIEV
jgi:hypothetical protein